MQLAETVAHARGLSVSLKNDVGQLQDLVGDYDFALNEQCLVYDECARYTPFMDAGKAVFHIPRGVLTRGPGTRFPPRATWRNAS